jgi:hypothetical protein
VVFRPWSVVGGAQRFAAQQVARKDLSAHFSRTANGISRHWRDERTEDAMKITRFEEIEAWKSAREVTNLAYRLTRATGFVEDQDRKQEFDALNSLAQRPWPLIGSFIKYLHGGAHPRRQGSTKTTNHGPWTGSRFILKEWA